jgi:lysophospholipase L1-like esterase
MTDRRARRRARAALVALVLLGAAACGGDDNGAADDSDRTTTTEAPLHYAALGDSFSSGEGAPPDDVEGDKCHQAAAAWPRRLDADSIDVATLDHRACSGSKTANLLEAWDSRDLPAQIPSTPDPDITLVTVTVGGNDAGFGDILGTCVLLSCPSPTDGDLATKLAALTATLTAEVYPALREAYPNARVAHVGYPRLTPAPGEDADCIWLSGDDQTNAAGIVDALNGAIEEAAETEDITYVDITDVLAGHELCSSSPWLKSIPSPGQAHPTAEGQRAIARAVADALDITL